MNFNQNFGQYGRPNGQYYYGYTARPQEKLQMRTVLTPEEQDKLKKHKPEFSGRLTEMEWLKALCCHRDARTGDFTIVQNNLDDSVTCTICDEHFHFVDIDTGKYSFEDIEEICASFNDIFQTIKLMNGNIPREVGQQLYVISGFIKKIPGFYPYAKNYFDSVGRVSGGYGAFGTAEQTIQMFMQMFPGMGGQMGGYGYGFAQPQPQQSGPIFNANGYQIDPMTGAVVFGPDGQPMTQAKYNEMVQQQSPPAAPAAAPTMGMAPQVYAAGPTMNYQAPVASGTFPGGSPVGIVTPEPGPATEAKVVTPEVTSGFKN